jgi:hypothetical protein
LSPISYIFKLEPHGLVFRVDKVRQNRIVVLVPTNAQVFLRMLNPLTKSAVEVVRRIGNRRSKKEFIALIKASTESYSGMPNPRNVDNVVAQHVPADQPMYAPAARPKIADQPMSWAPTVPPHEPVVPPQAPRQAPRDQRVQEKKKSKRRSTKSSPKNTSSCCIVQ